MKLWIKRVRNFLAFAAMATFLCHTDIHASQNHSEDSSVHCCLCHTVLESAAASQIYVPLFLPIVDIKEERVVSSDIPFVLLYEPARPPPSAS